MLRSIALSSVLGVLAGCGSSAAPATPTPDATDDGAIEETLDARIDTVTHAEVADDTTPPAGAPGAPTNLTMTAQTESSTTLVWDAATAGSAPIDHYRIYRNGVPYDTTKSTTYVDAAATNAEIATRDAPATIYDYDVSAVDAEGREGPRTAQYSVWAYRGSRGGSTWGSVDYSYGLVSRTWDDTKGAPIGGGTDIALVFQNGVGGGFQPYSNLPQVPIYDLEIGAFRYMTFSIKAEHASNDFFVAVLSRLPFGDVFGWVDVRVAHYATLKDGEWTKVKIPLADFHESKSTFSGSIGAPYGTFQGAPYATLQVKTLDDGSGIDNGGYVLGTGLSGGVYIVDDDQRASIGTFHVQGPSIDATTNVSLRSLRFQRSNLYKFNIGLNDGMPGGVVYLNDIAFTRD